jgi:uncharacterized membrane protein
MTSTDLGRKRKWEDAGIKVLDEELRHRGKEVQDRYKAFDPDPRTRNIRSILWLMLCVLGVTVSIFLFSPFFNGGKLVEDWVVALLLILALGIGWGVCLLERQSLRQFLSKEDKG